MPGRESDQTGKARQDNIEPEVSTRKLIAPGQLSFLGTGFYRG